MSLIEDQKEHKKQEEVKSLKRRYSLRFGINAAKKLINKANRRIFADEILQPYQSAFKQKWHTGWKNRKLIHDSIDRKEKSDEEELEEIYIKKKQQRKYVTTLEERVLKDIHSEHPNMMSESDIIKFKE